MLNKKENRQGSAVQHTVVAKQSEPPGSEVQENTSDAGVSKLPTNDENCTKIGKKGKGISRKEGGRSRKKQAWTKEERCVVWECFIRSGGVGVEGYRDRIFEMWNGRDLGVRSRASVLAQVKEIQKGGKLSTFEMREIESRVLREGCTLPENDEIDFVISDVNECSGVEDGCGSVNYGLTNVEVLVERLDVIEEGNAIRMPSAEEQPER